MSGTARAAMVTDEEQGQQAEFLDLLQSLEKGTVPVSTADAADARLNAAYQRIQHAANTASWGTVTKDGIRTAQRGLAALSRRMDRFRPGPVSHPHRGASPRYADREACDRA